MELPVQKLNLSVHLGDDHGQSMLGKVAACSHLGAEVNQIKARAKINEQIGYSAVFVIRYFVYPGREAEALKYLEDGYEQKISKLEMSPLQFITRNFEGEEDIENWIYSEEGAVCVKYRIKMNQDELSFLPDLTQLHKLRIEVLLKGFVSHTLKNRTNVKVDYSHVNITGEEVSSGFLSNILTQGQLVPEEVSENPFFITLMKARKLHLNLKFKSFRQINKYFNEVNEGADLWGIKKKPEKENFKYMAPGLFREKVEGFAFLRDDLAVTADITHQGEDIFLRLIKVYFKAINKAINM